MKSKLYRSKYTVIEVDSARFSSPLEDVVVNSTPLKERISLLTSEPSMFPIHEQRRQFNPRSFSVHPLCHPQAQGDYFLMVSAPPGDHLVTYLDNIETFSPFQNLELGELANKLQICCNFTCSSAQLS